MRLVEHYDQKYGGKQALPAPIAIVDRPRNRFEMLVKVASSGRGRYLEIGAGSGASLLTLEGVYDSLVGTELSPARAAQLAETFAGHENVKVVRHDIERERLDYPDGHFDTVAMCAVIEHLMDPIGALRELHRVLAPGGRLLLDTPNIAKWTRRIKLMAGYFPSTASLDEGLVAYDRKTPTDLHDEGHFHYFTYRSLTKICRERIGFRTVERHGYGRTELSRRLPTLFSDVFIVAAK